MLIPLSAISRSGVLHPLKLTKKKCRVSLLQIEVFNDMASDSKSTSGASRKFHTCKKLIHFIL